MTYELADFAPDGHLPDYPRVIIEQVAPHRWRTWVKTSNLMSYAGEYGTYALTERGATRKGHRLLRHYLRTRPRNRKDVIP